MFSLGNTIGVGEGSIAPQQHTPWLISALADELSIDIATGEGHCLALTQSKVAGR